MTSGATRSRGVVESPTSEIAAIGPSGAWIAAATQAMSSKHSLRSMARPLQLRTRPSSWCSAR